MDLHLKPLSDWLPGCGWLRRRRRTVALVLGGGGARGLAHIGAIESLEAHGYRIASVAGTSMGALVGGLYAAGCMDELRGLVLSLNRKRLLKLMDLSPGLDHIASARHLMERLDGMVGNRTIESLPIPFCCVASDVVSGEEHVFDSGLLKWAIRASISVPGVFKPVAIDNHLYVDGSVHNTLPLDRVHRSPGDLLVAVNVSAPDREPYLHYLRRYGAPQSEPDRSIWDRVPFLRTEWSANYMNMALRVAKLTVQNNARMAMRLTPPDICAEVSMDEYSLFDYDDAAEIMAKGRRRMDEALGQWLKGNHGHDGMGDPVYGTGK